MESRWKKSSRSSGNANNCVETRTKSGNYQVRDSKLGTNSPIFDLGQGDMLGLLRAAARR